MNVWHILQIEPTSNQREIKKAYAKQLKRIDEEDTQAFIRLREAFETAQILAHHLEDESENSVENELENELGNDAENRETEIQNEHDLSQNNQEELVEQSAEKNIENTPTLASEKDLNHDDNRKKQTIALDLDDVWSKINFLNEKENQFILVKSIEQDEFYTGYYRLLDALNEGKYDTVTFELFQNVLIEMQDFNLNEQLNLKSQLLWSLSSHDYHAHFQSEILEFLLLWQYYYPIEQNFDISYEEEQILEMTEFYQRQTMLNLPESLNSAKVALLNNEKFDLFGMLKLNGYLHSHRYENEIELDELWVKDKDENINFQYLKALNSIPEKYIWVIVVYGVLLFLPFIYMVGQDINKITLAVVGVLVSFALFIFAYAPLLAKVYTQHYHKVVYINAVWFYSAFVLCLFTPFASSIYYQIILILWTLLSYFIILFAVQRVGYFVLDLFTASERLVIDRYLIGFLLVLIPIIFMAELDQHYLMPLAMIPLIFIAFNWHFETVLIQAFKPSQRISFADILTTPQKLVYAVAVLVLIRVFSLEFSWQDYPYFYLFLLSSLFILLDYKMISYLLKYTALLLFTVVLGVIFMPFAIAGFILLVRNVWLDYQYYRHSSL